MPRLPVLALVAALGPLADPSLVHAGDLECRAVNGESVCRQGPGSRVCQTVNGATTCLDGAGTLTCHRVGAQTRCQALPGDTPPPPAGPALPAEGDARVERRGGGLIIHAGGVEVRVE